MTDSILENRQNNRNAFVASAAGAMVGAAAGMAAMALVDEKNRKMVVKNGARLLEKAKKEMNQIVKPIVTEKVNSMKNKTDIIKQDVHEADNQTIETPEEI